MTHYTGAPRHSTDQPREAQPHTAVPWTADSDALIGSFVDAEVVFLGPVGVGKSTAIATLSTLAPIQTEAYAATWDDFYVRTKTTTTVGIDYGVWNRADGGAVALYGTPGQERFEASRSHASNPDAALVLWFFGYEHLLEDQITEWLMVIHKLDAFDRLVLAVNFREPDQADPVDTLRELIPSYGFPEIPVVAADPRDVNDVSAVVERALKRVEEKRV